MLMKQIHVHVSGGGSNYDITISFPGPLSFASLVLNMREREPGNEVEIMDDIQGLKNPLPGHQVITCPLGNWLQTSQISIQSQKLSWIPDFFLALNYYIKHCHSSEQ